MPPKKASEEKSPEEIVEDFIESPEQKLENRIAVLERLMQEHLHYHFGGMRK